MNTFVHKSNPWSDFVSKAINHYAEQLGIQDIDFTVGVFFLPLEKWGGLCTKESINEFVIKIDYLFKYDFEGYMVALAHEMVHVKQYLRDITFKQTSAGQLKEYFRGKRTDHLKYMNRPCEKEAYHLQQKLYNSFVKTL